MRFIQSFRNVALAIFMLSMAQTAYGSTPEGTSGAGLRTEGSTFDLSLSVGNAEQRAQVDVSPEALRVLEALHRGASVPGQKNDVSLQSILQERLQRALNEGKLPAPEGAAPRISVKAKAELEPAREGTSSLDPCFVPGILGLWYTVVYEYPTCTYYELVDYYDALYNQCDGSYVLLRYLGSNAFGPYSCG